jgi:hypothetical protein
MLTSKDFKVGDKCLLTRIIHPSESSINYPGGVLKALVTVVDEPSSPRPFMTGEDDDDGEYDFDKWHLTVRVDSYPELAGHYDIGEVIMIHTCELKLLN